MNKFKVIAMAFVAIAIILSNIMCAHVAFQYCNMLWGIKYAGYSAPASVAFLLVIPYIIGIIVCAVLSIVFWKKSN